MSAASTGELFGSPVVEGRMKTPYRDDFEAAEEKLAALEQELATVKARAKELATLTRSEAALTDEVAALKSRLEGMAKKRALPLLESVRIASPCKADWNEMVGTEQVRFCGSCQKNVYNLSGMRRDEAERIVRENEGGVCVRLYRRSDGTVLTADCPVGRRRKRLRNIAFAGLGSGLLAAGALLFTWRSRPVVVVGDMTTRTAAALEDPRHLMGKPTEAQPPTVAEPPAVQGGMAAPDRQEKSTNAPKAMRPRTGAL